MCSWGLWPSKTFLCHQVPGQCCAWIDVMVADDNGKAVRAPLECMHGSVMNGVQSCTTSSGRSSTMSGPSSSSQAPSHASPLPSPAADAVPGGGGSSSALPAPLLLGQASLPPFLAPCDCAGLPLSNPQPHSSASGFGPADQPLSSVFWLLLSHVDFPILMPGSGELLSVPFCLSSPQPEVPASGPLAEGS